MALTNEDLQAISKLLEPITTRLDSFETRLDTIETDIEAIKIMIENEVTTGIKIVAEGHLDLNRTLNEAIHISSDVKAKLEVHDLLLKKHESRLQLKNIV